MPSSRKKSSRVFSARAKKDLRPHPPTAGSHGREASPPPARSDAWFGPQPPGSRKVARPFSANRPLEALFTASRARGAWRLDRRANRAVIARILSREASRSGVRVGKVEIGPTALRLEVAASRRRNLALFFRSVAGRIPRAITGSERGRPLATGRSVGARRFWDGLVATRSL